jgi:uncharacterized phage-associated protein
MPESNIISALGKKRTEIERVIAFHVESAEVARFDLAAVDRSLVLFAPSGKKKRGKIKETQNHLAWNSGWMGEDLTHFYDSVSDLQRTSDFNIVGLSSPVRKCYDLIGETAVAHTALTVARYFLSISEEDSGELISNLKLQKLLYYAQGYYVALHGVTTPLFKDTIYAWKHGPVTKTVYGHFSSYKDGAIPQVSPPPKMHENDRLFLNRIHDTFGRYSAWALRDMTHKEPPWLDNYEPGVQDIVIPVSDLHKYFSKYVKKKK